MTEGYYCDPGAGLTEKEFCPPPSVAAQAAKIDAAFLKDDDPEALEVLATLALLPLRRGYSEAIAGYLGEVDETVRVGRVEAKLNLLGKLGLAEQQPVTWTQPHESFSEGGKRGASKITSKNWQVTEAGRECLRLHQERGAR